MTALKSLSDNSICVMPLLTSVIFSHSSWDFLGMVCNFFLMYPGHIGIMLWGPASYLNLLFYQVPSDAVPIGEEYRNLGHPCGLHWHSTPLGSGGQGVPCYNQVVVELQGLLCLLCLLCTTPEERGGVTHYLQTMVTSRLSTNYLMKGVRTERHGVFHAVLVEQGSFCSKVCFIMLSLSSSFGKRKQALWDGIFCLNALAFLGGGPLQHSVQSINETKKELWGLNTVLFLKYRAPGQPSFSSSFRVLWIILYTCSGFLACLL